MKYQELLNTNIKKLRQDNNLTQEEFAEKIGISIQGLSNIKRNKYQPTADTIDRICKAFKVTPCELLLDQKEDNETIIKNIVSLLSECKKSKLKKIYDILLLMLKI